MLKALRNSLSFIALLSVCTIVLFAQTTPPKGANARLVWELPTTNEDGTPLTDLAGIMIKVFNPGDDVDVVAPLTSFTITSPTVTEVKVIDVLTSGGLKNGTYRFAAYAFDLSNNVSQESNVIDEVIKVHPPKPPVGFKCER